MRTLSLSRLPAIALIPLCLVLTAAAQIEIGPPAWVEDAAALPCDQAGETVTGTLSGGEDIVCVYDLGPGTYSAVAWASWDILWLGMTVRNPIGQVLARDDALDNTPVCRFTLAEGETAKVILTAGEARVQDVSADYALTVVRGTNCVERRRSRAKEILDDWTGVVRDEESEVVSWEAVELSGEDSLVLDYSLSAGSYTVIAETTDADDDIDMYVRTEPNTILSRDELPGNNPVCHFVLQNPADVSVEIDPWEYGDGDSTDLVFIVARESEPGR